MHQETLPTLRVVTRAVDTLPDLVEIADPQNPLLWVRDKDGVVGHGEVLRLEFFGADRFSEASAIWQSLVENAQVTNRLNLPGTGLMALGTFSFADNSDVSSLLIVPEIIVGRSANQAWVTTISLSHGTNTHSSNTNRTNNSVGHAPDDNDPFNEAMPDEFVSFAEVKKLIDVKEPGNAPVASFFEPEGEATAYREGVLEASRRIGLHEAEKIVLARRLQAQVSADSDLRAPLKQLADRYTDCWTFAVGGMLGASPETLIRSISGSVSALVLAGTRKRSVEPNRDAAMKDELKNSSKERFEHKLAVDSLIGTIAPYVENLKSEAEPHLLGLPNVWHLATDVSATLTRGADAIELAGAVHPTAAVAGTPTPLAVAAIGELEPFDRGRYAGAVGWVDAAGNGDFAIALRCAQVTDSPSGRTVTAFAGGGLVEGSDPWHELTETVAKFRPIIEAFA